MRIPSTVILAVLTLPLLSGAALASPACTKEPKSAWMSQDKMKSMIKDMGYQKIKTFKVTGSCYEIYGYDRDSKKAEVYFNPVDGTIVKAEIGG